MRQRLVRLAVPVAVGALALSACGSNKDKGGSSGGGKQKTATIGLIAPLSGALSALGLGMKNSIDLAVNQANKAGKVKGWTIKFDPQDDTATPDVGKQVASTLASKPGVVGVVGTLNSSVSLQVQPVLAKANIVQISPANTNPALTQGPDYAKGNKQRPFKSYFRVATTDAIQGPIAAQYLFKQGIKTVVTVDDKKTYGAGLVQEFSKEFTKEGGKVLDHQAVDEKQKDFAAIISKVKPKKPQAVYYGGEYPVASLLSKQMKGAGLNIPLMGGDGIKDDTYIKVAGKAADGDLATSVGAPTENLDTAKQFVSDYQAAGYKEGYSAYGAYSFDAANVIIDAMATALEGKDKIDDSVKQAVIDAVGKTNLPNGVTGMVTFDQYGDTTNKVITVYKITSAAFKPVQTGSFNG